VPVASQDQPPSRTGGFLCDPDSLLQGHAVWHLLCAGTTGSIYLYHRSERAVSLALPPG
jgi:hypothetical protein